ncbi:hypothetical protein OH76DRAFT_309463 [Lentinus brumalis]|uniref:Uncharacterized protein n=1 Tax=Lentinus brumalis TaxID=2498619 RepID=A0A371CK87_9APHY|nr:hypothetical protein OH76DRAFT_309463 [Polyporus brumalis]
MRTYLVLVPPPSALHCTYIPLCLPLCHLLPVLIPPANLVELVKHAITTQHHTEDNPITWNSNHDQDETILHRAKEDYRRAVNGEEIFHPNVNRLAGFLEFGALTIALAQSGGAQYKAGFLRL